MLDGSETYMRRNGGSGEVRWPINLRILNRVIRIGASLKVTVKQRLQQERSEPARRQVACWGEAGQRAKHVSVPVETTKVEQQS